MPVTSCSMPTGPDGRILGSARRASASCRSVRGAFNRSTCQGGFGGKGMAGLGPPPGQAPEGVQYIGRTLSICLTRGYIHNTQRRRQLA